MTQAERPVLHRWTRHEYEQLLDHGFLDEDDPIELLDGLLLVKEPQHSPHRTAVLLVAKALERAFAQGWFVQTQSPIILDERSEPEPDVCVARGSPRDYVDAHPTRPALIVEVAQSGLRIARGRKAAAYARAGIADYWIVNLIDRVLEVIASWRDPVRPGDTGATWRSRRSRATPRSHHWLGRPRASASPICCRSPPPCGDRRVPRQGGPGYHDRAMTTSTAPPRALAPDVDPVRFEVIRNALLAITEEMGATLRRAAYSTNIKTRGDFSCAFFDRDLRTIAQAFAQPSHLGSLAHIVPRAIEAYGADRLAAGDGILINDPYLGGVHLNDITLITPVFHEGALFGYVANIAHHVDVGGGAPGSIGVSSEIYQEGLVIPPVRFVKGGQIDQDLFAMIRSNFRGTREISGDFRAQTAANRLGAQRIEALVAQYGAATFAHYLDELLHYTERRTRAAFAEFPDGRFAADMLMDGDGVTDEPVKLAATVTIEQGRVSVDLTGCDDQRKSPTNATSSQTYSGVVYVLKCLIDPDIPVNDGFYRLIDIRSCPGSVVHAQHPAAVAAGWEIAMQLCDLLFKALAPALPDRVVAGTKGCVCNIAFGGVNPATGEYFTYYETIAGGYGATLTTDGMDAVQAHFQNTENAPVEETEANYPVRILRYALIESSEGGGRHRGGLGVRRDYTFPGHEPSFSILSDKARYAPWGLFGGGAARPAKYILNPDTSVARELPSKITFQLAPGDVVSVQTPGGGGTEAALDRDPALVAADVAQGKISAERARTLYGVVVDAATQALDAAATAKARAEMAR